MSLSIETKPRTGRQASHSNVVTSVAFSPDGQTLASGSWDGTIKLWDSGSGRLKLKRSLRGEWDEVEAVAFAPDGSAIAGLGTGFHRAPYGAVTIWALESGRGRPLIRENSKLDAIAFAPDGLALAMAGGDDRAVTLRDVVTGQERARLPDHRGPIWSVAFSPDGRLLAVASGRVPTMAEPAGDGQVGEIRLWDLGSAANRVVRRSDLTRCDIEAEALKLLRNGHGTTSRSSCGMIPSILPGDQHQGGPHGRVCTGNRTDDEAPVRLAERARSTALCRD